VVAASPAGDAGSALIMVVDDDPQARSLLNTALRREGYRVIEAGDGEAALRLVREFRPDAITLDILMPRIDGWSVLPALKSDSDLCEIPVIMVSVLGERSLALSLGAADFMTKPIDRARLSAILRRVVHVDGVVLVVDDEPEARNIVSRHLDRLGW